MKKIIILMFLFLITIASAFAAFEVSTVSFGSDRQKRAQEVTTEVVITNTDASKEITEISISFNGASKYDIDDVSKTELSLSEGAAETVVLSGFVPLDLDAVNTRGRKIAVNIGTVVVKVIYDNDPSTEEIKTVTVTMEAENLLRFTNSKIMIGEDYESTLRDGRTYNTKRDDDITLELIVENRFGRDGDCDDIDDYGNCDIEDIEAELWPSDSDFDEYDVSFRDIRSGRTESQTIKFVVPDYVDDGEYRFDLWTIGYDENGARHGQFIEFSLDVVVSDDEITIKDAYLIPERVPCDATQVSLRVLIENTGRYNQRRAAIEIESARLDIAESIYNIDLNEGMTETRTFALSLPENLQPGSYFITIKSFYDNNKESDIDSVELVVEQCYDDSDEDIDEDDDKDSTDVIIIDVPPSTGVIVGEKKESSFFESNAYTLLLGFLFIIALLMFFIILIVLLRK